MKIKTFAIILITLLLALPANALALGITPGERIVPNEPAKTFEYRGLILNRDGAELTVTLEVGGDLKQYISVSPKEITFAKGETETQYTYQVLVPFSVTGNQSTGYILVSEKVENTPGMTGIGASLAVKSRITIGNVTPSQLEKELVKVDAGGTTIETQPGVKTTGMVVGNAGSAGLFSSKLVGGILILAGLLIMSGLVLVVVYYKKQRKGQKQAKSKKGGKGPQK